MKVVNAGRAKLQGSTSREDEAADDVEPEEPVPRPRLEAVPDAGGGFFDQDEH